MCVCVYISLSLYIYIYIHICTCICLEYSWVTDVEASHVCAKFSRTDFEVCILEPLLNHHFINQRLRVPDISDGVTITHATATVDPTTRRNTQYAERRKRRPVLAGLGHLLARRAPLPCHHGSAIFNVYMYV